MDVQQGRARGCGKLRRREGSVGRQAWVLVSHLLQPYLPFPRPSPTSFLETRLNCQKQILEAK